MIVFMVPKKGKMAPNTKKKKKKDKVFLEKHYFDHLPPFVLGDY